MLHEETMRFFERTVTGRRYRIAAQSVWDPVTARSVGRQIVLGPADAPPLAELGETRTVGTRAVGDVGALAWVAEQIDLVGLIDHACGVGGERGGPTLGEIVVAVAIQRACDAGPKRDLAQLLTSARIRRIPIAASRRDARRVRGVISDRAHGRGGRPGVAVDVDGVTMLGESVNERDDACGPRKDGAPIFEG